MRASSHQPLSWAPVWPHQERAPPPEIPPLLVEVYTGKKMNGRRRTGGRRWWRAGTLTFTGSCFMSPLHMLITWYEPFLSSEDFGINTSQLQGKRRNCNISHLLRSLPAHIHTYVDANTLTVKKRVCVRDRTSPPDRLLREWIITLPKGTTMISGWYLKPCHWI